MASQVPFGPVRGRPITAKVAPTASSSEANWLDRSSSSADASAKKPLGAAIGIVLAAHAMTVLALLIYGAFLVISTLGAMVTQPGGGDFLGPLIWIFMWPMAAAPLVLAGLLVRSTRDLLRGGPWASAVVLDLLIAACGGFVVTLGSQIHHSDGLLFWLDIDARVGVIGTLVAAGTIVWAMTRRWLSSEPGEPVRF